jgi:hypothetical protein
MNQSLKKIKEVQMSIKMEPELRDQFMAAASEKSTHPAG